MMGVTSALRNVPSWLRSGRSGRPYLCVPSVYTASTEATNDVFRRRRRRNFKKEKCAMATTRFLRFGEVTLDLEKHTVLREGLNSHLQEEYWSALVHLVERGPELVR